VVRKAHRASDRTSLPRAHGLGWIQRRQLAAIEYLRAENQVLREQLGARGLRLTNAQRRRLAVKGRLLGRKGLQELASIVTPETILRWYRELIARKYDGTAKRGPGRPRKAPDIAELVQRMARENPRWGYTRIVGAMKNLGHEVGRNTVKRMLAEAGISPAPERRRCMSWKTFLRAHWEAIAAADFFTVEVLTLHGLTRYFVFFVIELKTRRVEIAGIVHQPDGEWMMQVGRNLLDAAEGFLLRKRYPILDRDPLYTAAFRRLLRDANVKPLRLPARSPNLNAYAERFVRSIRDDCLNRVVLLGEQHLRTVVGEYVTHYHRERNHQGLGNALITPQPVAITKGVVQRRARLGGLLSYYHRGAA
jgi:transposase InsO family protein